MHWIFSCGVRHHVVGILINFVRLKRHPNPRLIFQLFPLFTVDVDWMLIRDLRTSALALASPVRDQISWVGIQVLMNLFVTAQTVFWAFRNFTPSPSPFICKSNVGLATSTYSSTMFESLDGEGFQRALNRAPDRIQFLGRSGEVLLLRKNLSF